MWYTFPPSFFNKLCINIFNLSRAQLKTLAHYSMYVATVVGDTFAHSRTFYTFSPTFRHSSRCHILSYTREIMPASMHTHVDTHSHMHTHAFICTQKQQQTLTHTLKHRCFYISCSQFYAPHTHSYILHASLMLLCYWPRIYTTVKTVHTVFDRFCSWIAKHPNFSIT